MSVPTRICPFCEKIFVTELEIRKHIQEEHFGSKSVEENASGKLWQRQHCEYCGKSFNTESFVKHAKKCSDLVTQKFSGNEFQCKACKKSYDRKDTLAKHVRRTHTQKRYNCEHCEKVFRDRFVFKRHQQSTHVKIQYRCERCTKVFSRKDRLSYHLKMDHELLN